MGLYDEFRFRPASWLPNCGLPLDELERIRNIRRDEMEYENENGFSVKVVLDPTLHMVQDMFYRILMSDIEDRPFSMICPNQWPAAYSSVANMLNRFNISARNVHAFAMDEWADEDGNVAPLTYGAGLGYSFLNHFYYRIREDLRPPLDHWHIHTNENSADGVYSQIIDDITGGGADVVYSATGWPGHTAFIDPGSPEFAAGSLEEFCSLGSRIVTEVPLPSLLSISILPCMAETIFLTMLMPSPVPSIRDTVELCTRSKGSKMRCRKSSLMPMPLSRHWKVRWQSVPSMR